MSSPPAESIAEENVMAMPTYPPYPPYEPQPIPPTVADVILLGQDIRYAHKSGKPLKVKPSPRPARPKSIKATTEVRMTPRERLAHARCLRRYGVVLTDRLERISKPDRRKIIYMWRERQDTLPAEKIARLRSMLDADEPFKPEQAYDYFLNLRKSKKKPARGTRKDTKKDVMALWEDRRYEWARNAAVAFARGIQQRLARPGMYSLQDEMLRLSNIILQDICYFLKTRTPSRHYSHPKARLMVEIADKVAVWISDVLQESEDRMLMMDFDENDEVMQYLDGEAAFADDFLNMMGGGALLKGPNSAYLNFTGNMKEVFKILTDSMYQKGKAPFISHGKFEQTYGEAADELKAATTFTAKDFNTTLANTVNNDLTDVVKPFTPKELAKTMEKMVRVCSNYLAQTAEYNKDKGKAFHHLVKSMKDKRKEQLYEHGKDKKNMGLAASDLVSAKGFETSHDDPNLSQAIHTNLKKTREPPPELHEEMKDTLDQASKYLSERAVRAKERGPAFDIIIKQLQQTGNEDFAPDFKEIKNNHAAAYVLNSAPGLTVTDADPKNTKLFSDILHSKIDIHTPKELEKEMKEVINRCAQYLSSFLKTRDGAFKILLDAMKGNSNQNLVKRNDYSMSYGDAVTEIETAQNVVPHLPVKDIADEITGKLNNVVQPKTPPGLEKAMKTATDDSGKYLSQMVAIRSGVAGETYGLEYLAAVKEALGDKPLYDHQGYSQNYKDAAHTLKYAGELEHDPKHEDLQHKIHSEMKSGVASQVSPTMHEDIHGIMGDAAKHLAKEGAEKGEAMGHLIDIMKQKGDEPLGVLQGYEQTYKDGARRIENASTLANDKVEKAGYENVRAKLTQLAEGSPHSEKHADRLPGLIEESAKFLAAPVPKSEAEKRAVLADMMGRKGDDKLAQAIDYQINYTEGGKELQKAPKIKTSSKSPPASPSYAKMQEKIHEEVKAVVPEKRYQELLKGALAEGAAHLTDVVKGRGAALDVITKEMKKEKDAPLVSVGKYEKTHAQAAKLLIDSPKLTPSSPPSPAVYKEVHKKVEKMGKSEGATPAAQKHMQSTLQLASNFIAAEATVKSGLTPKELAALEGEYGFGPGIGKDGKPLAIGGSPSSYSSGQSSMGPSKDGKGQYIDGKWQDGDGTSDGRPGGILLTTPPGSPTKSAGSGKAEYKAQEDALALLHKQLQGKGEEVLYKQPLTTLTHKTASDWIKEDPKAETDSSIKDSADTNRLANKFEKKLNALVEPRVPPPMKDAMQDVIIEKSRQLSERFVEKNYNALVKDRLVSEMQKKGNEIVVDVDGNTETYFYSAQRLKIAPSLDAPDPWPQVAHFLHKKLDDLMKVRPMPRKLVNTTKEHTKDAANFLSRQVTHPDEQIAAYVALLEEMEARGEQQLIDGPIAKSYKDSAAYLHELTSFTDRINRPNEALKSSIIGKLKNIMPEKPTGYSKAALDSVIQDSANLLTSYVMLQGEKTEALKVLIDQMDKTGSNVLLRHGDICKTYREGADKLRGKNADQIGLVSNVDPVVARKISIKLSNLMKERTPYKFEAIMDDVIEDVTLYLAANFLHPHIIKVCKCMKNVFVQCELWCDEILRHVSRPCCTCSRHTVSGLCSSHRIVTSQFNTPDVEISLVPCPDRQKCLAQPSSVTEETDSTQTPTNQKPTTSYSLHSVVYDNLPYHYARPKTQLEPTRELSIEDFDFSQIDSDKEISSKQSDVETKTDDEPRRMVNENDDESVDSGSKRLSFFASSQSVDSSKWKVMWQTANTMFGHMHLHQDIEAVKKNCAVDSQTSMITTDEMSDWHAMVVSLLWNMQAWRRWIQDNVDIARSEKPPNMWELYEKQITAETLKWRHYNVFSRQLTLRLATRYKNKRVVSPTRATDRTDEHYKRQTEMLEVTDMFRVWTQWLNSIVSLMSHWEPSGAVWVVSACGAVPSGAVPCGAVRGENTWLARTTHRTRVLPATLHPSKHCCIVYAEGGVHHYTKYQVLCNANVCWSSWRSGEIPARAVCIADGVYAGRVVYRGSHLVGPVLAPSYRCHVVLFGRPFAFNCYQLLVQAGDH